MNKAILICLLLTSLVAVRGDQPFTKQMFNVFSQDIKQIIEDNIPYNLQFNSCKSCLTVFNLIEKVKLNQLKDELRVIATNVCNTFMDADVCQGIMVDYFNSFFDNFFARYLNSDHVCIFLKACDDETEEVDFEEWKKMVLADKPNNLNKTEATGKKSFNVLHLTDLHTDLEYLEGALAECDQPFCCRPESGIAPTNETLQAKYWGSNAKCDLPLRTVDALLADSKNKGDIDMIVWTGDNTSHDVWHQQQSNQTLPQHKITELIEKHFPKVPKYPMFGNHEAYPADQYDISKEDSTRWIKTQSANMWKSWLQPQALLSLLTHGFYSQYNKDTNVRVIALNTQVCDILNFYLISNNTDPNGEIEFLRKELYIAEKNKEKAFIIAHIPPGDNTCASQWAQRYQVLVDRFENTIIGQFFGHTHNDHFETIKSSQGENRSVGTVFIAPSGTSYSYQSPSYRIFAFEDEQISNYFQYRLDLNKANKNRDVPPVWDLAYDFKSEYNLPDLSNQSIYDLAFNKLLNEPELLKKYVSNFWTASSVRTPSKINGSIRIPYTCMAQNIIFDERTKCFGIYALTSYPEEVLYKFIEILQGPWLIKKKSSTTKHITI